MPRSTGWRKAAQLACGVRNRRDRGRQAPYNWLTTDAGAQVMRCQDSMIRPSTMASGKGPHEAAQTRSAASARTLPVDRSSSTSRTRPSTPTWSANSASAVCSCNVRSVTSSQRRPSGSFPCACAACMAARRASNVSVGGPRLAVGATAKVRRLVSEWSDIRTWGVGGRRGCAAGTKEATIQASAAAVSSYEEGLGRQARITNAPFTQIDRAAALARR